jgi:N-acetylglutamate synthase-like GNAT family acetyltransferase
MPVYIRAAEAVDQQEIRTLVRAARLNPMGLDWVDFLVAEDAQPQGRILAGVGQLRPHSDGSRELASLAVAPAYQGQGIGRALVRCLLDRGPRPLYLFCRCELVPYYSQFGFTPVTATGLPPVLARRYRIGQTIVWAAKRVFRHELCIAAMVRRDGSHPG